jgi:hypothetical protein
VFLLFNVAAAVQQALGKHACGALWQHSSCDGSSLVASAGQGQQCACLIEHIATLCFDSTGRHLATVTNHILRNLSLDGGHQVILFPDKAVHTHLNSAAISWGPNIDPTAQV